MRRAALAASILLLAVARPAVQSGSPADAGIAQLLARIEEVSKSGDSAGYLELLSTLADRARATEFVENTFRPGATRVVLRERDRRGLPGTLPGDGYQLMVEVLTEFGERGQVATWRLDVRRKSSGASAGADDSEILEWGIVGQERLTFVDGLHRLALNPRRQYSVRNLTVNAVDLALTMAEGTAFAADTEEGVTALVLMGRGQMTFKPTPATERGQVKLFAGSETLRTQFDAAFVRMNPAEVDSRLSPDGLAERAVNPRQIKRAGEIFREEVGK